MPETVKLIPYYNGTGQNKTVLLVVQRGRQQLFTYATVLQEDKADQYDVPKVYDIETFLAALGTAVPESAFEPECDTNDEVIEHKITFDKDGIELNTSPQFKKFVLFVGLLNSKVLSEGGLRDLNRLRKKKTAASSNVYKTIEIVTNPVKKITSTEIATAWMQMCLTDNIEPVQNTNFQLCESLDYRKSLINAFFAAPADTIDLDTADMLARINSDTNVYSKSISSMPILAFGQNDMYFNAARLYNEDTDANTAIQTISLYPPSDPQNPITPMEWQLYGNAHHVYSQFSQLAVSANALASAQGSATHFNFTTAMLKLYPDQQIANTQMQDLVKNLRKFVGRPGADVGNLDLLLDLTFNINPLVAKMAHSVAEQYLKGEKYFVGSDIPCMLPFFQNNDAVYASYADAVHVSSNNTLLVTELKTRWAESLAFSVDYNAPTHYRGRETLDAAKNSTRKTNLDQTLMQALCCNFWYGVATDKVQTQLITVAVPYEEAPEKVFANQRAVPYSIKSCQMLLANMMLRTLVVIAGQQKTVSSVPTHYTDAYCSFQSDNAAFIVVLIMLLQENDMGFHDYDFPWFANFTIVQSLADTRKMEYRSFVPQICVTDKCKKREDVDVRTTQGYTTILVKFLKDKVAADDLKHMYITGIGKTDTAVAKTFFKVFCTKRVKILGCGECAANDVVKINMTYTSRLTIFDYSGEKPSALLQLGDNNSVHLLKTDDLVQNINEFIAEKLTKHCTKSFDFILDNVDARDSCGSIPLWRCAADLQAINVVPNDAWTELQAQDAAEKAEIQSRQVRMQQREEARREKQRLADAKAEADKIIAEIEETFAPLFAKGVSTTDPVTQYGRYLRYSITEGINTHAAFVIKVKLDSDDPKNTQITYIISTGQLNLIGAASRKDNCFSKKTMSWEQWTEEVDNNNIAREIHSNANVLSTRTFKAIDKLLTDTRKNNEQARAARKIVQIVVPMIFAGEGSDGFAAYNAHLCIVNHNGSKTEARRNADIANVWFYEEAQFYKFAKKDLIYFLI